MSAHTKGPWTVGAGFGMHGVRIEGQDGNAIICGVVGVTRDVSELDGSNKRTVDDHERWANARLIAAAPELLEALQGLSAMYSHAWDMADGCLTMMGQSVDRFEDAHEAAHAAINKAAGSNP